MGRPDMLQTLLWIEIALKAGTGFLLLLMPRLVARGLALPAPVEPFWARLLGGVLVGLAVAIVLEGQLASRNGLGLAGSMAINLVAATTLMALLILGTIATPRRGRALLWLIVVLLWALSLVELAWIGEPLG